MTFSKEIKEVSEIIYLLAITAAVEVAKLSSEVALDADPVTVSVLTAMLDPTALPVGSPCIW